MAKNILAKTLFRNERTFKVDINERDITYIVFNQAILKTISHRITLSTNFKY